MRREEPEEKVYRHVDSPTYGKLTDLKINPSRFHRFINCLAPKAPKTSYSSSKLNMAAVQGGCLCGKVRYEYTGSIHPKLVYWSSN